MTILQKETGATKVALAVSKTHHNTSQ